MKKFLYTIFLSLILSNILQAESSLPECQGNIYKQWTDCFGTEKFNNGTYIGEYKKKEKEHKRKEK